MTGERIRAALSELALAFAGLLLGILAFSGLRSTGVFASVSELGIGLVGGPLITGCAAAFYAWTSRRAIAVPEPIAMPAQRVPGSRVAIVTAACVGLALLGSVVLGWIFESFGVPVQEQQAILEIVEAARSGEDRATLVVLGASAVLLAPIAEEWLFRGLLFRRLLGHTGRPFAYVASALGFAAIHDNPAGFVIYLWLGLVFALAIDRTDRLGSAIAVHVANNAFAFAMLVLGEG